MIETDKLIDMVSQTSGWEWLAVFTALLYVVFASFRWVIAWPIGAISSFIYAYIFFGNRLFLETGLQVFYVVLAFYGWFSWSKPTERSKSIRKLPLEKHILLIGFCLGSWLLVAYVFDQFTTQNSPYGDAFVTVFSLAATWMTARKYLANWTYWIVIDVVAASLFFANGLLLSSLLYVTYALVAIFGFFAWKRQLVT
jgi:nicotinamide mononucleotide transporter